MTERLDITIPAGRIRAERSGSADAPLTIAVPGLSASLRVFDFLVDRLVAPSRQILTIDLRGRGDSSAGPPGSYGWPAHAADVLAVADAIGTRTFSVIGYSMGAAVAMEMGRLAPGRVQRAVLIDACCELDAAAVPVIRAVAERTDTVFPSVDAYLALLQQLGTICPWSEHWERYFRQEMVAAAGGVRQRSDRAAVMEDELYGETHEWGPLWPYLDMPVLLLRAKLELALGLGYVVPPAGRDAFLRAVPTATCVEVDANHYGIGTNEATANAIAAFLADHVPTTTPPSTLKTAPFTNEASSEAR